MTYGIVFPTLVTCNNFLTFITLRKAFLRVITCRNVFLKDITCGNIFAPTTFVGDSDDVIF